MAAEHQRLQQQALVGANQQTGELLGRLIPAQLTYLLSSPQQLGQPIAEAGQEALASLARWTGARALQLSEQHAHQPRLAQVEIGMAKQEGLQPGQGRLIQAIHRIEVGRQRGGGPTHRLLPQGLAAGKVPEQSPMADAHARGDGRRADLIRGHGVSQLKQGPHSVGPALSGGNRGGPRHGGAS